MPRQARECRLAVDAYLRDYVDSLALPPDLDDALRYALLSGGKRIRPVLAWLTCAALEVDPASVLPVCGAVELVHAFSLVHDDLPSIDNDDLRRGRPALHVHSGEAGAILAGDAMMTLSMHLLSHRISSPALAARLVAELSIATCSMIVGQVMDLEGEAHGARVAADRLAEIHENKTGALITASCRMGAIVALHERGEAEEPALTRVSTYARAVGLMFQIVDDLLDVEQSTEWIGKRARSDAAARKLTYPALHGTEASRAEIRRLHDAGVESVDFLGESGEPLRLLAGYLASRTR